MVTWWVALSPGISAAGAAVAAVVTAIVVMILECLERGLEVSVDD